MNSTSNAVVNLNVEFGDNVFWIYARFRDIPDSRALHHVPHSKTLDGLILWRTSRAVRAPDELDVSAAVLVATIIPSLFSHFIELVLR